MEQEEKIEIIKEVIKIGFKHFNDNTDFWICNVIQIFDRKYTEHFKDFPKFADDVLKTLVPLLINPAFKSKPFKFNYESWLRQSTGVATVYRLILLKKYLIHLGCNDLIKESYSETEHYFDISLTNMEI